MKTTPDFNNRKRLSQRLTETTALASILLSGGFAVSTLASAEEAANMTNFDEIVVTARKRSETLLDVPMSINVVSEARIEKMGANDFTDILGTVPSLTAYQNGPGRTRIAIRGVSNGGGNDNDTQNQETVGVYLDEIPISMGALNPELSLFDLERVEVLRGPQGTLYGAGSMSGTIRLVSKKPNLNEVEGKAEVGLSTINKGGENYSLKGLVNVPIIEDKIALRTSGYFLSNGGYIDNVLAGHEAEDVNNGTSKGVKVAARFQVNDALTLDFTFMHHDYSDNGRPEDVDSAGELARNYPSFDGYDDEMQIYNLTMTYDMGAAELVSSTSYFKRDVINPRSLDQFYVLVDGFGDLTPHELVDFTKTDTFVQELRVASTTDSPLQWTVGTYFDQKDVAYENTWPVPGSDDVLGVPASDFGAPTDYIYYGTDDLTVKSFALFGEAYYSFDKLTVTAGLRYFNWKQDIATYVSGIIAGGAETDNPAQGKADGFNPKLNVSYDLTDDMLVYGQVARGFRYGGINASIPLDVCGAEVDALGIDVDTLKTFAPDKTWNYEAGVKGRMMDGKLMVNAAVFLIKWDDVQTSRRFECGFGYRENVTDLTSKGVEFEVSANLVEGLTFSAGGTYMNSNLDTDIPSLNAVSGDRAPYVPEFSLNATLEYVHQLSDEMDGFVWLNYQHVGHRQTEFNRAYADYRDMDAYNLANIRVGVTWDNMEVSLFADNLFDSRGVVRSLRRAPFDPDGAIRVQPRTIGLTAKTEF
ncbi:TonB-dependent receptor [Emcibacter sp.]|uniref:TonB-dependent receptor n=1 Tax=Emcibacter sp. TaxID=1979954 RepID=UPI003A91AF1C